jgi:hypothetical protein
MAHEQTADGPLGIVAPQSPGLITQPVTGTVPSVEQDGPLRRICELAPVEVCILVDVPDEGGFVPWVVHIDADDPRSDDDDGHQCDYDD